MQGTEGNVNGETHKNSMQQCSQYHNSISVSGTFFVACLQQQKNRQCLDVFS